MLARRRRTKQPEDAAELYRTALQRRPAYPAAHLGLARVLLILIQYQAALDEIEAARRTRPVRGSFGCRRPDQSRGCFTDEAVESVSSCYQRSEVFQPEAHVGLREVLEDKVSMTKPS